MLPCVCSYLRHMRGIFKSAIVRGLAQPLLYVGGLSTLLCVYEQLLTVRWQCREAVGYGAGIAVSGVWGGWTAGVWVCRAWPGALGC